MIDLERWAELKRIHFFIRNYFFFLFVVMLGEKKKKLTGEYWIKKFFFDFE